MNASLAPLLARFHAAILTRDDAAALADVKPNPRLAPAAQLGIYIEGYRSRLTGAIRADYPALLQWLGEAAFDALAHAYIEAHPPTSASLDDYPIGFAAFLAEGTRVDTQAARDLAQLEAAIAEVFLMPDSTPLDAARFAGLTPEDFGHGALHIRFACRLLELACDAEHYLTAERAGTPLADMPDGRIHLCIVRHKNEVRRHRLSGAAYRLLSRLITGDSIIEALERHLAAHPQDNEAIAAHLQSWLTQWLESGFFRQDIT